MVIRPKSTWVLKTGTFIKFWYRRNSTVEIQILKFIKLIYIAPKAWELSYVKWHGIFYGFTLKLFRKSGRSHMLWQFWQIPTAAVHVCGEDEFCELLLPTCCFNSHLILVNWYIWLFFPMLEKSIWENEEAWQGSGLMSCEEDLSEDSFELGWVLFPSYSLY